MSQFTISSTVAPPPPAVPTSFVCDSGIAIPAANVLNVNGGNGLLTLGAGNTITVYPSNVVTGSGTTIGAVTADLITFALGATPTVYAFDFEVAAFNVSTPAGAGYRIRADVRTTGAAGVIINSVDGNDNEEASLIASDYDVVIVGNNAVLRVTGCPGLTIRWKASCMYTVV
jgi:hypothetical protein